MAIRHLTIAVLCCAHFLAAHAQIAFVKDAPFQATRITTNNQSGELVTTEARVGRSSNGSTYQEFLDARTGAVQMVLIADVSRRKTISLNLRTGTYTTGDLSVSSVPGAPTPDEIKKLIDVIKTLKPMRSSMEDVGTTTTPLGVRTQDGFMETGQRLVLDSLPLGSHLKEKVWESWSIPSLGVTVENTGFDDNNKPSASVKLINIQTKEPDPNLFEIPPRFTLWTPPSSK